MASHVPPIPLATLALLLCLAMPHAASAQQADPSNTVTIVVPGFDPAGASLTGPFGVDYWESLLADIAQISGASTIQDPGGMTAPNLVTECQYYGDIPPAYYTAQDLADLNQVTQQWGGGVPRYALIMAKFTREVLNRTGAAQANIAGGSFGGLISRYMIRHDLEGLASSGRIARWVTMEGVNNGSWSASNGLLTWLWAQFNTPNIDVSHMNYSWIEANLNNPRDRMSDPIYGSLLVGHTSSTHDTANNGALTAALLLGGVWEANDGVLMSSAGAFTSADPVAMYRNRLPTRTWHPVDHYNLSTYQGAWLTISAFLTSDLRVTVRATAIKMHQLSEGGFLNPLPAEIALESSVTSPLGRSQWSINDPMCSRDFTGGALPIYNISTTQQWIPIDQMVFDDFVMPGETDLELNFSTQELDWELRFGITEVGGVDYLGSSAITIPVGNGSYTVTGSAFDLQLEVNTQEYPFARNLWLDRMDDVDQGVLAASGEAQTMVLDFGPSAAGLDYFLVGTISGTSPGVDLQNGLHVPINPDRYTDYLFQTTNTALHQGFSGQLDSQGRAVAVMNSTAGAIDLRAIGQTLSYVAILQDASGPIQASAPVSLEFR